MNVAFISSEVSPYASTGGLADVAKALPGALDRQGVKSFRVMPFYRQVAESGTAMEDTEIRLHVPLGMRSLNAEVWVTTEENPKTYFIRRDEFFDRSQLYSMAHRDYDDNFERFVFFQKAVVQLLDELGMQADIVHCNDWQTGLLPLYLRYGTHGMGRACFEKSIYTIHNLAYQGLYDGSAFSITNLPFSSFSVDGFEFYGQINCMKAGIAYSDRITTVSKSYAEEIQTVEFGCGLEGVLQTSAGRLHGIPNGVDYAIWNPETDEHLKRRYSAKDLRGKSACKKDLMSALGLSQTAGRPLIGMITRLTEQKGLDILAEAMDEIMNLDVCIALLGNGEARYHTLCREWQERWPDRFSATLAFDIALSHRIEGGADLFLMPSRFEPCGLNQLYSLKYGTVPIVHATGGLKDTIRDVDADPAAGNGYSFDDYSPEALTDAVGRAVAAFTDRSSWLDVVRRIMTEDHSWDAAAKQYISIYERCLAG